MSTEVACPTRPLVWRLALLDIPAAGHEQSVSFISPAGMRQAQLASIISDHHISFNPWTIDINLFLKIIKVSYGEISFV
jgi:hypothetical protein